MNDEIQEINPIKALVPESTDLVKTTEALGNVLEHADDFQPEAAVPLLEMTAKVLTPGPQIGLIERFANLAKAIINPAGAIPLLELGQSLT